MPSLPLFPLGAVLLPGGQLPLQVFEPRYLRLLEDLFEEPEQERVFGVVAIRRGLEVGADSSNDLYAVGCSARVMALGRAPGSEGAVFHLLCVGERPFRLDGTDETAGTPYPTGLVTWLDDLPTADPHRRTEDALRVAAAHAAYARAVGGPAVALPGTGDPAYAATEAATLPLAERQAVLEAEDAAARADLVVRLLARETALVTRFGALPHTAHPGGAALN